MGKQTYVLTAISLATCKLLCQSPNSSIASVAHSLLIKRFASLPDAVQILTHDAQSSNERVQRQARQAVQFLRDYECEMHETLPLPLQYADDLIYRGEFGNMRNTRREEWDAFAENRGQGRSSRDSDVVARLDELSDEIDRIESRWRAITSGQARVTTWDRPRARGEDEAETRRRRREAMVFREGGGRIEEEDIFRPVRTVSE